MIGKGLIFYIGCALIPTPPSPCPDFGLQLLVVIIIGLLAPKKLVRPIYLFFRFSGRSIRDVCADQPVIGPVVVKADSLYQKWKDFLNKKRQSDSVIVEKFYKFFLRRDLMERVIFGYFIAIIVGLALMLLALCI